MLFSVGGVVLYGLFAVGSSPARAATSLSHTTSIASVQNKQFVTADIGLSGTGAGSKGVLRARATAPGPWEDFDLVYVHDLDASAPTNEVYLYSYAANNYVTAEFSWTDDMRGILHARSGSTSPGPWETFFITRNDDGSVSFSVHDSSGGTYYVTEENGSSGDANAILRARSTKIGDWERFMINSDRFISGYNDYPWVSTAADSWIGGWQYTRECDSFVAWKIYQNDGGRAQPKSTDMTPSDYKTYSVDINGPPGGIGPNAGDWGSHAPALGIAVNGTPTVGSAAQWNYNGDGGRFKVGHVGLVTAVFPDKSINIAQYNLLEDHQYSTMHLPRAGTTLSGLWVSWPDNFVHVQGF